MSYNLLIGVGGTGAKVLESAVHAIAAGELFGNLTDEDTIVMRVLEMDANCGNLNGGLRDTLKGYDEMRNNVNRIRSRQQGKNVRPLPRIDWGNSQAGRSTLIWKIRNCENGNMTLQHLFSHEQTDPTDEERLLFEALYSESARERSLNVGCNGRPKIGSLYWKKLDTEETGTEIDMATVLNSFAAIAARGSTARCMIVGSMFGGTGASGIPMMIKRVRKYLRMAVDPAGREDHTIASCVGAVMLLPYYTFRVSNDVNVANNFADPREFSFNSKLVLQYYKGRDWFKNQLDYVSFVGDSASNMVRLSGNGRELAYGGDGQKNPALPTELEAVASIVRFFEMNIEQVKACVNDDGDRYPQTICGIRNESNGKYNWSAFDFGFNCGITGNNCIRLMMQKLTRIYFAYRYLDCRINREDRNDYKINDRACFVAFRTRKFAEDINNWGIGFDLYINQLGRWLAELNLNGMSHLLSCNEIIESKEGVHTLKKTGFEIGMHSMMIHGMKISDIILCDNCDSCAEVFEKILTNSEYGLSKRDVGNWITTRENAIGGR